MDSIDWRPLTVFIIAMLVLIISYILTYIEQKEDK